MFSHNEKKIIWLCWDPTNMDLLHPLYVIITIVQVSKERFSLSANISNDTNKKLQELKKENEFTKWIYKMNFG